MNEDVKRWLDIAAYDKVTAEAMYKSGRYLYVLFMCQQAVEKTLKGIIAYNYLKRTKELLRWLKENLK